MTRAFSSRLFVLPLLAALGCAGDGAGTESPSPGEAPPPTGTGGIDFESQVQPIFTQNCACHQSFSAPQGEILLPGSTYDATVNVPSTENPTILRIKPGDPDSSYLVIKIDDAIPGVATRRVGERMPRGLPPLKEADIQTIRKWVKDGAQRAASPGDGDPRDKEPPEFSGATLAAPAGPNAIDVFWDNASDNKTPRQDMLYKVFLAAAPGKENFRAPSAASPPGASTVRVEGLKPETRYYFVARAQDSAGNQDSNLVEVSAVTVTAPPPPAGDVDFDTIVLPLFRKNCVRCHGGFANGACPGVRGRCFDSYKALKESALDGFEVIPFDSNRSEMVKRIRGISTPRMPFDGPPFLTEAEIQIIEAWIDAGAKPSPPSAENRPPVADAGGPYSASAGSPVTFSGAGSFDPDGDPLTFEWDFGDGQEGTGANPRHTYSKEGSFTITLVLSDGKSRSNQASAQVTIVRGGSFPTNPTMERICSQCHGVRIVLEDGTRGEITPPGQGKAFFQPGFFQNCNLRSAQAWKDTISRMRNVNKCPMTDQEQGEIRDFLASSYSGGDPRADGFHRVCSDCHSPSIPTSVPRSPDQWQQTVDRMINRYEARATAAERDDIIGYLSQVARGTPPTELPEAQARIYMNLVCSTCHSPERVMDGPLPDTHYRRFDHAIDLTREMMSKGCGLRGVTDVIIARWLSSVTDRQPDILSINSYQYEADEGKLEVKAWSSLGGAATLRITGEGGLAADLSHAGGGSYELEMDGIAVFPGRILISSSLGGSLIWHRKLSGVKK
jgi:chitodextrinase